MDNKELDLDMEEVSVLALTDADGKENLFEYLGEVEYEGKDYMVVTPFNENADAEEVCEILILEIVPVDEEYEDYIGVTDEALQKTIFELFQKQYSDLYPFGD